MNEPEQPETRPVTTRAPIRLWPVILILVAALGAYVWIRLAPHRSEQHFNLGVAKIVILSVVALLVWLLVLSRLPWIRRSLIFIGFLAAIAALAGMFRIRGVTGNLVPILEPRWAHHGISSPSRLAPADSLPAAPGAADFPQFLGPNRNGVVLDFSVKTNWEVNPPQLLWRQQVGAAWSGFVVSGALAITQEQRGEDEFTVCYELLTGKTVWTHGDKTRYATTIAGEGPRATPSIAKGCVFAQGATGILNCLDLASGRLLWTKDILKDNQSEVPAWGLSSSPLVVGEWVVVIAGGKKQRSIVAYRALDGTFVWGGGTQGTTHASPLYASLAEVPQFVVFGDALVSYDARNGTKLWQYSWPGGHPHIATPIVVGSADLIVSSGYGTGSGRVRVEKGADGHWSTSTIWRSNRLKAKFTNPVLYGGCVYGLDDGIMACINADTGALNWKEGRYGHGQILLVDKILLIMAENGAVILVDPQPDGLRELTRFSALGDKTWNPPALAGDYLVVRNDKEAACYRVQTEKKPARQGVQTGQDSAE